MNVKRLKCAGQCLAVAFAVTLMSGSAKAAPPSLACDYNDNGVCDAADYTVWRDTLGLSSDLRADGYNNGIIDMADYEFWKANFGQIAGGPGGGSVALGPVSTGVPEPATWLLATSAMMFFGLRRVRR